ncbi:MAG TPA: UpxY family transcription antiterminator [Candidatus Angelobacter sp.]|jgi:transcription antitermination factor NusG
MEPLMSTVAPALVPSESCAAPEWFAIYVMTRHEKRIAQHLQVRQIEHFLPLYETRRKWRDGSNVTIQLPLFPSYLFVRAVRGQRVRALEVPGVLSAVGKRESSVISDTYIESLRKVVSLGKVEPHPYLTTGTVIHIRSGVMAGLQGIVVRQKSSCRVVLSLELIQKSVSVEVDIADL